MRDFRGPSKSEERASCVAAEGSREGAKRCPRGSGRPPSPLARVARRPNLLSYLRRLCLRVASAAVESRLCMSSGALPGPDLLRVIPTKRAPDASSGYVTIVLATPLSTYSPRKTAARGLSQRGNARRRGAGSTASVGEPDADVGVAEAGVSGPLRANIVRAPRFSVRAAAARQYWQVIIIRDLRRRPVP